MKIKSILFLSALVFTLNFLPAFVIPSAVQYKLKKRVYSWGEIRFRNEAIGNYSDEKIRHQISVDIIPNSAEQGICRLIGRSFFITSNETVIDWKKSIWSPIEGVSPLNFPVTSSLYFISKRDDGEKIPLTLDVSFELLDECEEPGVYRFKQTIIPQRRRYWLSNILFDVLMSV